MLERGAFKRALLASCEAPRTSADLAREHGPAALKCIRNCVMRRELINVSAGPVGAYVVKSNARRYTAPRSDGDGV